MVNNIKRLLFVIVELSLTIETIHSLQYHSVDPEKSSSTPTDSTDRNLLLNILDTFDPKRVEIKNDGGGGMCDGYSGILKINNGDMWAASGTAFFVYVINQIIYAENHNLLPWVHFSLEQSQIYDHDIHDPPFTDADGNPFEFTCLMGATVPPVVADGDLECCCFKGERNSYPGAPDFGQLEEKVAVLDKSGVWEHYFEPVSDFRPRRMTERDRESCATRPLVDLAIYEGGKFGHLFPGMHFCAPWSVRVWKYDILPKALSPVEGEPNALNNWLGKMRQDANRIVTKYIHPLPWLEKRVDAINPRPNPENSPPCLAMHIRHTDKGHGRRRVLLEEFLPYAEIFVANGGETIYLATDALSNVDRIKAEWPEAVSRRVRRQEDAFLSTTKKAVFRLTGHHRANVEALVDIYAMARCGFMVHGLSAISESAIYVNGDLHRNSVNLEDEEHMTQVEFEDLVRHVIHQ